MALKVVFAADQARLMVDAIGRTLFRLFISRRHLLECETAAATEHRMGTTFVDSLRQLWSSSVLALTLGLALAWWRPEALPAAVPVLALWLVAPAVAHWVSRLHMDREPELTAEDRRLAMAG